MEKVDQIITNKFNGLTEADKTWLQELSEEQLDLLMPVVNEEGLRVNIEAIGQSEFEAEAARRGFALNRQQTTLDTFVETAPEEFRTLIQTGIALAKEKRTKTISGIMANSRNKFTQAQLEAKSDDELEALAELADVKADFSGNAGGTPPVANAQKVEPMAVPGMPSFGK